MITFDQIGDLGRLGNQMFQYAALRGIAAYHGYEWIVPPEGGWTYDNYGLFECFTMPEGNEHQQVGLEFFTYTAHKFEFDKDYFESFPDNANMEGYFQTEKYFKHIESKIGRAHV